MICSRVYPLYNSILISKYLLKFQLQLSGDIMFKNFPCSFYTETEGTVVESDLVYLPPANEVAGR